MEVHVGVFRHVVIENDVYSFDIHSSSKQVCGHEDSLLEVLERLVSGQPGYSSRLTVIKKLSIF